MVCVDERLAHGESRSGKARQVSGGTARSCRDVSPTVLGRTNGVGPSLGTAEEPREPAPGKRLRSAFPLSLGQCAMPGRREGGDDGTLISQSDNRVCDWRPLAAGVATVLPAQAGGERPLPGSSLLVDG